MRSRASDELPITTSARIVEASVKLFNERGFQSVAALQIAKHMGISSGNLAYHFKSKNDIVLAVFPLLERAMRETKQREGPFLPSNAALHLILVCHTLWQFRFFFNSLPMLLVDHPLLRKRYRLLEDTVVTAMQDLLDELVLQKYMRPVATINSTRLLARSCWMVWLSWVRHEHINHPRRQTVRSVAINEAVLLNWSILQSYFPEEFAAQMLAEVRKRAASFDGEEKQRLRSAAKRKSPKKPARTARDSSVERR